MIDALLSGSTIQTLEQTLSFTEQRHQLLLADISNASTPGAVQKDLSTAEFQKSLRDALAQQRDGYDDPLAPHSGATVDFVPTASGARVVGKPAEVTGSVPFHDRGVRSMEYLMSQLADNAMAHNMVAQFLKNRYDILNRAISMKV